jgi:hypothetical protein
VFAMYIICSSSYRSLYTQEKRAPSNVSAPT